MVAQLFWLFFQAFIPCFLLSYFYQVSLAIKGRVKVAGDLIEKARRLPVGKPALEATKKAVRYFKIELGILRDADEVWNRYCFASYL